MFIENSQKYQLKEYKGQEYRGNYLSYFWFERVASTESHKKN